jgi:hypothetical protein
MFEQTITSVKVEINAPIEVVWNILTDLDKYSEWNPFVPRMESTLVVGDPIIIHVQMNAKRKLVEKEQVSQVIPYRRLAWRATYPKFFIADERIQELEPLESGNCSYYSYETFQGLAIPFVMMAFKKDIQRGFNDVSLCLKRRAEAMN